MKNVPSSGDPDTDFAALMRIHHQGAVDMSTAYLRAGGIEEKLKSIARKIISDQQKEIQMLQDWLQKNE